MISGTKQWRGEGRRAVVVDRRPSVARLKMKDPHWIAVGHETACEAEHAGLQPEGTVNDLHLGEIPKPAVAPGSFWSRVALRVRFVDMLGCMTLRFLVLLPAPYYWIAMAGLPSMAIEEENTRAHYAVSTQ